MNTADIAVAVIVVLCGIIALRLGLVRVVLGLAGWVGATLATIYGYSHARPFAREWIGNELIADIAAGAAIFVVTMIILTFLSHAIAGGVRDSAFGMLDRTFGLLAGLAIGAVVVSGGYIFSQQVFELNDKSAFYSGAKTLPLLKRGADVLASAAPSEWGLKPQKAPDTNSDSTFRSLLSPKPESSGTERKSGYKPDERQEMDRLIRSHQ
jgi:membrane protein required for colicin V production